MRGDKQMKTRAIVVLVLALVCGASAAVGVSRLRQAGGVDTACVVVARGDIPRGRMLTEDQVEIRDWPSSMIPRHAVQKVEDVVGRAAAVPIVAGDVEQENVLHGRHVRRRGGAKASADQAEARRAEGKR